MVNETQPGLCTLAPDDLVVPAFVVGAAVARARRALARSRRIPGLSLFLFGAGRGRVKTAAPHVPALPWSVGLSPALLWLWAARGDRGQRSPVEAARPTPERAGDRLHPLPLATGLEAVAPALVLVRSLLGAPADQAPSRSSIAPGSTAPGSTAPGSTAPGATRRRGPGGFSFVASVAAARPAIVRVAPTENAGRAASLHRDGRARAFEEGGAWARPSPVSPQTFSRGAPPVTPSSVGAGVEPTASFTEGGRSFDLAPNHAVPEAPVTASLSSARSSAAITSPPAASPARRPERAELRAPGPALPWGAPSIARSRAELGPPTPDAPPRLPQRDAHAAPVAMKRLVEVADSLRTFVAREGREAREAVSHAASRRLETLPEPSFIPSDDDVRKLLSRMRTMMQEERFRSGKIR